MKKRKKRVQEHLRKIERCCVMKEKWKNWRQSFIQMMIVSSVFQMIFALVFFHGIWQELNTGMQLKLFQSDAVWSLFVLHLFIYGVFYYCILLNREILASSYESTRDFWGICYFLVVELQCSWERNISIFILTFFTHSFK